MAFKPASQSSAKQTTGQTTETGRRTFSAAALNDMFRAPMARSNVGETLGAYLKGMQQVLADDPNGLAAKFTLVPVDGQSAGLITNCIALVGVAGDVAAVYTYILEGDNTLMPRTYKERGVEYEIPSVAGDLYCEELWERISSTVQGQFPGKELRIVDTGGMVLPSELSADDANHLRVILYRSTNAIYEFQKSQMDEADVLFFNAAEWRNLYYSARCDFRPGQTETGTGLPVRRDISITLTGADQNQHDKHSVLQHQQQLSRLNGYVDFVYVGKQPGADQFGRPIMTERQYLPRLIITDTNTALNSITLELQLLSLATASVMQVEDCWMQVFQKSFTAKGKEQSLDLQSLAGFGHELGVVVDTNDDQWNLVEFMRRYTLHDQLTYTLHVEETGDLTWIQSLLRDAAEGPAHSPAAYDEVIAAANRLTDGHFATYFKAGDEIGQVERDRVILGYYFDATGVRRDVRDIDYLAMLNLFGATDMATVEEFGNTFLAETGPDYERLDRRVRILRSALSDQLHVKGYATPVNLNPAFLNALYDGIQAAGLTMRFENHFELGRTNNRANLGLMQYAMNSQDVRGRYSRGAGTQAYGYQTRYRQR